MPNYPQPADQWLGNLFTQIRQMLGALSSGGTSYVVDPTIANPSASTPNCRLILGNVTVDNFGNPTGLPASSSRSKWGLAVYNPATNTWSQA
ncbi:MAG: hypothetical protein JO130_18635 [Solirubrobacterales bacterium]|nr:hypothetical protein [Solirubrobacterales bacterium]